MVLSFKCDIYDIYNLRRSFTPPVSYVFGYKTEVYPSTITTNM